MSTLTAFSEQERAYHQYQARQEFLRLAPRATPALQDNAEIRSS
jgi:hypothetical protein